MKQRMRKLLVGLARSGLKLTGLLGLNAIVRTAVTQELKDHGFFILYPPYHPRIQELVSSSQDPVRYATMALALTRVLKINIQGNLAEVGVWRGYSSRIIHAIAPDRPLYLFDTFEGFREDPNEGADDRFRETSVERVKDAVGDLNNVIIRKGVFPSTAEGLESERFAFVLLDVDKYTPTMAALKFFYPRVNQGGYIFVHDYNSPESQFGVSRAVNEFMAERQEKIIEIPDLCGSIMIRKC